MNSGHLSSFRFIAFLFALLFFFTSCQPKSEADTATVPKQSEPRAKAAKVKYDYNQPHRNQFHFSPEANWMNDPNGMVYYDGEYHLFYQYYPDSTVWGPMHWAHAVSEDLVHWQHLPIALYPDELGYIFSGSAVIDHNNTSGFGKDGQPPMIAIYTYHDMEAEQSGQSKTYQYQAIAYSNDKGRNWTKYEGNPVIPNPGLKDFRDPKVIWDEAHEQWLMVFAAYDHVKFYGSKDLKEWEHLSDWGKAYGEHGGIWECPDIIPMTVEESGEKRWVLLQSLNPGAPNGGSGTQYFIGDFDGKNFVLDPVFKKRVTKGKSVWLDYGRDNYAGVTWSNIPESDGRKLFIGWMSNWDYAQEVPTKKWRSAMTLSRELSLHKEADVYQLRSNPVKELAALEKQYIPLRGGTFKTGKQSLLTDPAHFMYRLNFKFKRPASSRFALRLSNKQGEHLDVGFAGISQEYFIDRSKAGKADFNEKFSSRDVAAVAYDHEFVDMIIYIDHSAVELFADEGRTVITDQFFPSAPLYDIELVVEKGEVELVESSITKLKGIW